MVQKRLRRNDAEEETSGDSVNQEIEVAAEFTIELNNFATLNESAKESFAKDLKVALEAELAGVNPFEGGQTVVSIDFVAKSNTVQRQMIEVEEVAKITVKYIAPEGTTRESIADKISVDALKDVATQTSEAATTTLNGDTFSQLINQASVDKISTEIQESIKPSEVETTTETTQAATTQTVVTTTTPKQIASTPSSACVSVSLMCLYMSIL